MSIHLLVCMWALCRLNCLIYRPNIWRSFRRVYWQGGHCVGWQVYAQNSLYYPPWQLCCGRGVLDYPSFVPPSVLPFPLNNYWLKVWRTKGNQYPLLQLYCNGGQKSLSQDSYHIRPVASCVCVKLSSDICHIHSEHHPISYIVVLGPQIHEKKWNLRQNGKMI